MSVVGDLSAIFSGIPIDAFMGMVIIMLIGVMGGIIPGDVAFISVAKPFVMFMSIFSAEATPKVIARIIDSNINPIVAELFI